MSKYVTLNYNIMSFIKYKVFQYVLNIDLVYIFLILKMRQLLHIYVNFCKFGFFFIGF